MWMRLGGHWTIDLQRWWQGKDKERCAIAHLAIKAKSLYGCVSASTGEVSGTAYSLSEKGWVDTVLFRECLKQYAVTPRPLLLVLDGYSSHYQPELIHYAKENDVIMICLTPRSLSQIHAINIRNEF